MRLEDVDQIQEGDEGLKRYVCIVVYGVHI